jgi:hypothetical protein
VTTRALAERQCAALERIASALEKMVPEAPEADYCTCGRWKKEPKPVQPADHADYCPVFR